MAVQYKINWIREAEEEIDRAFAWHNVRTYSTGRHNVVRLWWEAFAVHQFTLNVDGSVKTVRNIPGLGAVLRNNKGDWIGGCMCSTSHVEPSWVEEKLLLRA